MRISPGQHGRELKVGRGAVVEIDTRFAATAIAAAIGIAFANDTLNNDFFETLISYLLAVVALCVIVAALGIVFTWLHVGRLGRAAKRPALSRTDQGPGRSWRR